MDVSSFMGGSYLTHLDLPQPSQVWTVREVKQELVGTDTKIVVYFAEHQKGLGLNKVNLRVIAGAYTVQSATWVGRHLDLFKDQTQFQGKIVPCVRVRIPAAPPAAVQPAPAQAAPQPPAPLQVAPQQPVAPPAPQQQPQAAAPWEQDNSPPSV